MAIRKRYVSPRQKMINLMYVVLMAMLALNVEPAGSHDGFPMKGTAYRTVKPWQVINRHDKTIEKPTAVVIPQSMTVFRGEQLKTQILLADVDTIHQPLVIVDDDTLHQQNGYYAFECPRTGTFSMSGEMLYTVANGDTVRTPFRHDYRVIDRSFTAANQHANVLYAGIENVIEVGVPGIPQEDVTVTADGASIKKVANGSYAVRPQAASKSVAVNISCVKTDRRWNIGTKLFVVRPLPDPVPYFDIATDGGRTTTYKGGTINKNLFFNADHLSAAIDDGVLHVPFRVNGFETVFYDEMGNAIPLASNGSQLSERQRTIMRQLSNGRRFFISRIRVTGPDGTARTLNTSMEVAFKR